MFFKKKDPTAVHQALDCYVYDTKPIKNWLTQVHYDQGVLELGLRLPSYVDANQLHQNLLEHLTPLGVDQLNFNVQQSQVKSPPPHPRIRHILAIASGKGGVGKSTTAVNLALALKAQGLQVGLLDADIYGPSLPAMLGIRGKPCVEYGQFIPLEGFGMPVMSIGSLLDDEHTPVAWRGIKAVGALMQLYQDTAYPNLDYLLIDMPPGTGDIALTLTQKIPITAAIIVTTPQHIALLDVKKGIELFGKTNVPVMGIVENMAMHTCSECGHTEAVFGACGADTLARTYGVPVLARLPLLRCIGEQMDKGDPAPLLDHYASLAEEVMARIDRFAKQSDSGRFF